MTQSLQGNKGGAATMAELMAKHKTAFVSLQKGASVKAKITKLTSSEILVDAGAKTEAHVLEKDRRIYNTIRSMFKVGDTVEINVLNPESQYGYPVVSLRRYLGQMAWDTLEELLKSKKQIEVKVAESTKAGYVVETDFGISGFLPQSHTSFAQQALTPGQTVKASILDLNRPDNKVIFSQKAALSADDFEALTKEFKIGQKLEVSVVNVTPFGMFVSLPSKKQEVEGFIHISEIAWNKVDDLSDLYKSGQKIEAVISKYDAETQRVNLSVKRLTADPFEQLVTQYPVDKKVSGVVLKIDDHGVTLSLADDVEGLIKKDKIPPTTVYEVGQKVEVTISDHDKRKHRLILSPVLKEKPLMYR
jgi:small subunit ribosomal protein S1